MSEFRQALTDYLAIRRALGSKLGRTGRLLEQFVDFCEQTESSTITNELALRWATLPSGGDRAWFAQRLSVVRGFARHLAVLNPATEIPPAGLLPGRSHRAEPYLYSEGDLAKLMAAARGLRSPLRAATFETLVGLLFVTGIRVGEAIRLDRQDVDLAAALLTVRESKGKSRALPIDETTVAALNAYVEQRRVLCPSAKSRAFFVSLAGTRLLYCNVHLAFLGLVRDAGLVRRSARCRPRPHDLRHSFAVRALIRWYREGVDVAALLPVLSTYLGHVNPAATYWYLSAAPELLTLAAGRLDSNQGGVQ